MSNKSNNYLETLGQLFAENGNLSQEKMLGLMDETMAFFHQIKAKLESDNPTEQQEAFNETMEMKRILESKIQSLCEMTGLNPAELSALAENPDNMSSEEKKLIDAAKARLQQIQNTDTSKKQIKTRG